LRHKHSQQSQHRAGRIKKLRPAFSQSPRLLIFRTSQAGYFVSSGNKHHPPHENRIRRQTCFQQPAGLGNFSRNTIRALTSYYPGDQYILFTPRILPEIFKVPVNSRVVHTGNVLVEDASISLAKFSIGIAG
jgi:hypothetical protein